MDEPYHLLSNVPYTKAASTTKKKFNKLTLGPAKREASVPDLSINTQRQLYFDPDDTRLTDDDEEAEKENRFSNSPDRVNLVDVRIKQRYSEAVVTLTDEMEFQMSKLELSLTQGPLTDDQKMSEPLFHTESTEDHPLLGVKLEVANISLLATNQNDSVVTISSANTSALTEQAPEIEVEATGEEEDPIIIIDEDDEEEQEERPPVAILDRDTDEDPSIEDPSLDDTHFSATLPSKSSEPNCSAPYDNQPSQLNSSVMQRLSDFFNRIPDFEEPAPAPASETSEVDLTIPETPPDSPHSHNDRSSHGKTIAASECEKSIQSTEEHSVIDNSLEEVPPPPPSLPLSLPPQLQSAGTPKKKAKQIGSQEINIRTQVGGEERINISAKIKVDIVIRTQEASSSEEEEEEDEEEEDDIPVEIKSEPVDVKKEPRTPPEAEATADSTAENEEFFDTVNSVGEEENSPKTNARFSASDQRNSREIAEMDTQSNSPGAAAVVNTVVVSESFPRFEDTPKGRQSRISERVAEMDTVVDSNIEHGRNSMNLVVASSMNIAEMDTEVNTEEPHLAAAADPLDDTVANSIELDDASIAILHSIYGDNWRTPQLMRSMKRTTTGEGGAQSAESSFQANMTDFQKFNANVRRDLESTRVEKRLPGRGSSSVTKTKSAELPAVLKTPVTIFKTPSLVVQSPYFSNKKTKATTPATAIRTPLKATPKYKKILQIVDTDSSDEEEEDAADSDDSYKINRPSSESSDTSDSSASSSSSGRNKKRGGGSRGAVAKKQPAVKPKTQRKTKKNDSSSAGSSTTSRKGFDFTQIASSDSELDDTIFIDRDAVFAAPIIVKVEKPDQSSNISSIADGGKRKLFSDLNYQTPTSSISSPDDDNNDNEVVTKKVTATKEIRFPWLHDLTTPARHKSVDRLKGGPVQSSAGRCGFLASLDMKISRGIADVQALVFRDQYKQRKEELALRLFHLYDERVFEKALSAVPVRWNKKLLTTAGRCVNMSRLGQRSAEVELSEKVLTSADRLRCTLIHEMCHAAAWIVDGEKKGHAGHWKKWTERAVRVLPELPKITVRHDYNIEYKYTYQCVKCTAKTQMHSKTKKAENIRCRFCHGDIEILLNKRTKTGEVVKTPVRAASGFALYVKENYGRVKQPQLKHAEVMKLLSQDFAGLKVVGEGGGVAGGD